MKNNNTNNPKQDGQETSRREFLKKLGKYSAVTSMSTVTLLASRTSAASVAGKTGGGTRPPRDRF